MRDRPSPIVLRYSREQILNMSLRDFIELHKMYMTNGTRIYNVFAESGLTKLTVGELCMWKRGDIVRLRNFGEASYKQLTNVLLFYGIKLGYNHFKPTEPEIKLQQQVIEVITPIINDAVERVIRVLFTDEEYFEIVRKDETKTKQGRVRRD